MPVLLVVAAISGIAQSMVLVTYITIRTAYSPDALLGRIGSTARTISLGLQPVGLLIGGALIDLTNGSTTIAVLGIGLGLVSIAFVPVRALRRAALQPRDLELGRDLEPQRRIRRDLDADAAPVARDEGQGLVGGGLARAQRAIDHEHSVDSFVGCGLAAVARSLGARCDS